MDVIYDIINQIRSVNGTKAKKEFLQEHGDNQLLQDVLKATYDMTINYYLSAFYPSDEELEASVKQPESVSELLKQLTGRVVTGNAAREAYIASYKALDEKSREVLYLILNRNLKCGLGAVSINHVWKGLIAVVPYMRCSLPKSIKLHDFKDPSGHYIVQEKMDGMFVNIVRSLEDVSITTRVGTPISTELEATKPLAECFKAFHSNTVYHGELTLVDADNNVLPREIGNGLISSILSTGDDSEIISNGYRLQVHLWDAIPYTAYLSSTKVDVPYSKRFDFVSSQVEKHGNSKVYIVDSKVVDTMDEAITYAGKRVAEGGEGAVVKLPSMKWKTGTSKEQLKLKQKVQVELEILGFNEGTGKNKDLFGSLYCNSRDGMLEANVSSSGMKQELKEWISANRDAVIGRVVTITANRVMEPQKETGATAVFGDQIVRRDPSKASLFLPVFVELRLDKTMADSYDEIQAAFQSSDISFQH